MKTSCKVLFIFLLVSLSVQARDHLIFSIAHEIPMGFKDENTKKNYYVNIGSNHGVKKGTILNVFRTISKQNPYDNQNRINYRVKIGELSVLHTEGDAAITQLKDLELRADDVLFEIRDFMVGDYVNVKIKD